MLPSGLWRSVLGISLALGLLSSSPARAEAGAELSDRPTPPPLDLTWVSPDPSCDGSAVTARALELVPRGVSPAPLNARAELSRAGSDWIVELTTRGENTAGRRVLRGSSCQEIQQAIALLLAMILEAESKPAAPPTAEPKAPSPAPPVPPPPPSWYEPTLGPTDGPVPPTPTQRAENLGWLLRVDGLAGVGWQPGLRFGTSGNPGVGLGFGGTASAVWKGWELGLSGAYWPVTSSKAFDGRASLQTSRGELGLVGCRALWQGSRLGLAPCVGGGASIVSWRSVGLDVSGQDTVWFGILNAYLDLRVRLSGWLFLLASPGVAWERPQAFGTHVSNNCANCVRATLFQAWALEPRLKLGVGASF